MTLERAQAIYDALEPSDVPVLAECAGCRNDIGPRDIVHIYWIGGKQVVIHEDVTCLSDYIATLSTEYDYGSAADRLQHNVWDD